MKLISASAGLGAAVGAVLFLVLRFGVGSSVLNGVGGYHGQTSLGGDGVLYGSGVGHLNTSRALPVGVGAGLVAGLLIGAVLWLLVSRRASRVSRPQRVTALVLIGLVVGSLLAIELHAYGRHPVAVGDFGWYAYSPLTNTSSAADGYGGGAGSPWWPLVITGAVVGLVVGAAAAGLVMVASRTRRA